MTSSVSSSDIDIEAHVCDLLADERKDTYQCAAHMLFNVDLNDRPNVDNIGAYHKILTILRQFVIDDVPDIAAGYGGMLGESLKKEMEKRLVLRMQPQESTTRL